MEVLELSVKEKLKSSKPKFIDKKQYVYEKPEVIKIEKMNFMFEPFKKGVSNVVCKQCSSCHGCR